MTNGIEFSKFRINEPLAQRVSDAQRPRESMTSAVIRIIHAGLDAPLRDEVVRLNTAQAMTAINAGRPDVAFEHLRVIMDLGIMPKPPTPRSDHETPANRDRKVNP